MHHFSVWAPRASSCAVQVDGVTYAMSPASRGWWQADVDAADYGSTYQFLLDSDPHPYPDPRSAWQPDSVHGPSRLLNQSSFTWSDDKWSAPPLSEAIIYELHIGTFTPEGTFTAAIEHLKYLKNLGITHVELMPVNSFPGRWGWGYDGVSLFAPQEKYGGPEALKQLVDACHAAGLAVLLDVVYNHFGPVGNYTGKYGPYITEQHHTPWGGAINFEASMRCADSSATTLLCGSVIITSTAFVWTQSMPSSTDLQSIFSNNFQRRSKSYPINSVGSCS